jgi:hypothetical protein
MADDQQHKYERAIEADTLKLKRPGDATDACPIFKAH